jgi:hypothetical protein
MRSDLSDALVKSLFIVASKSRRAPAGPYADLLDRAVAKATSVEELTRLKEQAKAFLKEAGDRRHRDAATLLYHAAVAAAFVHHGATISGRPMRKQQVLYEKFAGAWEGRPIGRVFAEAARRVTGQSAEE